MGASLYGYALMGRPLKNRWRWLAWLIAVSVFLLAAGIPTYVGLVIQWTEVAAGDGDVGQAVGTSFLAFLLLMLTAVVVGYAPGQWRYHRQRDAEAAEAAAATEAAEAAAQNSARRRSGRRRRSAA